MCSYSPYIFIVFIFSSFEFTFSLPRSRIRHQFHKEQQDDFQISRHPNSNQLKSVLYPNEVCWDRRYWKTLPDPEGVIGYGYNAITGRPTFYQLFNWSHFEETECRLSGRRSKNDIWDMYRLPSYVSSYTFYDESNFENSNLKFEYSIYNSTLNAILDARNVRSLPFEINENITYDSLYITSPSVPLRPYIGSRSYFEALEDLASHSKTAPIQKSSSSIPAESAAPVLYSIRASFTSGEFELKSNEKLSWRYLDEKFRQRLRRAIVDDDFLRGFFDEVGTHYAKAGTFGGLSERWWISRRRPERKCAVGEESKILDAGLMAVCDRLRLADGSEQSERNAHAAAGGNKTDSSNDQRLSDQCHLLFDDERFRASRWMVTSGGPEDRLKAAHIRQVAFSGHSAEADLREWLTSLNDEPSTIRVDLEPVCDLLFLVDERPWHVERCREQLLTYIKFKDPFYAGKGGKSCSNTEVPLKFDKSTHRSENDPSSRLIEIRGLTTNTPAVVQYCVPTTFYNPERTCRANDTGRKSVPWVSLCIFSSLAIYMRK